MMPDSEKLNAMATQLYDDDKVDEQCSDYCVKNITYPDVAKTLAQVNSYAIRSIPTFIFDTFYDCLTLVVSTITLLSGIGLYTLASGVLSLFGYRPWKFSATYARDETTKTIKKEPGIEYTTEKPKISGHTQTIVRVAILLGVIATIWCVVKSILSCSLSTILLVLIALWWVFKRTFDNILLGVIHRVLTSYFGIVITANKGQPDVDSRLSVKNPPFYATDLERHRALYGSM